jgi:hypothetical protein
MPNVTGTSEAIRPGLNRHVALWVPPLLALVTSVASIRLRFGLGASFFDATEYLSAASSILAGHGFPRDALYLCGFHPPLYPGFIALVWKVFGVHLIAIQLMQAGLFAASAAFLARIALMATGRAWLALLAGVLFAFDPLALNQVGTIQAEPLQLFLLVFAVFLLLRVVIATLAGSCPWWDVALGGSVLGLACLTRDGTEAIVAALAVALWWLCRHGRALTHWGLPAAMVTATCLVIAPWTILNWRATGDFIPVSTLGGCNLWIGNNPASLRVYEGRFAGSAEFGAYGHYLQRVLPTSQTQAWGRRYSSASPGARQQLWLAAGLKEMVHNPGTTAKLWAYKTWGFWRPWLQPLAYSHRQVVLSGVVEVPLYAFALVGLVGLLRQRQARPFLWLVLAVAVGSTLVSAVSISNVRYRVATVDPYLYVLGTVGLVMTTRLLRIRRGPARPSASYADGTGQGR